MSLEVEVLAPVLVPKDMVLAALSFLGAPSVRHTDDTYFYDPLRSELQPDASGRLRHCLRMRCQAGRCRLTWKDDIFDAKGGWLHSDEFETNLEDPDVTREIIGRIGLKELVRIVSEKRIWHSGCFEVVLEDVEGLGLFLEVEIKAENGNRNLNPSKAKDKVRRFVGGLGIALGPELDAGKPELMLARKKQADSQV